MFWHKSSILLPFEMNDRVRYLVTLVAIKFWMLISGAQLNQFYPPDVPDAKWCHIATGRVKKLIGLLIRNSVKTCWNSSKRSNLQRRSSNYTAGEKVDAAAARVEAIRAIATLNAPMLTPTTSWKICRIWRWVYEEARGFGEKDNTEGWKLHRQW